MGSTRFSNGQRSRSVNETIKAQSAINVFSPQSSIVTRMFPRDSILPDNAVTETYNRRLVHEIINNIFDDRSGHFSQSSSQCSTPQDRSSEYSYDKRLHYWKGVLNDRKYIAENIKHRTGKSSSDILFNRTTTVDERDKQTVKRVIDYANRLNPLNLAARPRAVLPEYVHPRTCRYVPELEATLPKAERDGEKTVEIIGLPSITKEELLGKRRDQGKDRKSSWLRSCVLKERIVQNLEDIDRVVEYYPDIQNLQVVGENLAELKVIKHNSEIELIGEEPFNTISSDTVSCEVEEKETVPVVEPMVDYAIKINDEVFKFIEKRSSKNVEVNVHFECEPFEEVVKRVLHLENVGRNVLNCVWAHRSYYVKTSHLLKSNDDEFVFNHKPFRLLSGMKREIVVKYQPRRVDVIKMKWVLKFDVQFFCRKTHAVTLKLNGKCKPPPMYLSKLNHMERIVIEKSNMKVMHKLTTGLASLAPLNKPHELICPYQRALNDLELFEQLNPGYVCDRYHDLELLKDIYKRVKYPRERPWDLRLDTLRSRILRLESSEKRAFIFSEMISILDTMKGQTIQLDDRLKENPERDRCRLTYVVGLMRTSIDEWEELTITIEEAFLKPAVKEYYMQLAEEEEGSEKYERGVSSTAESSFMADDVREMILKNMRRRKAFRDSLYIQTYTHLCNVIEDIVSVIESTEVI